METQNMSCLLLSLEGFGRISSLFRSRSLATTADASNSSQTFEAVKYGIVVSHRIDRHCKSRLSKTLIVPELLMIIYQW